MVEALTSDGADQPLDERILSWAPRSDKDLLEAHTGNAFLKGPTVDLVSVPQQVLRRILPGERLHDLLRRPSGGRIRTCSNPLQNSCIVGSDVRMNGSTAEESGQAQSVQHELSGEKEEQETHHAGDHANPDLAEDAEERIGQ